MSANSTTDVVAEYTSAYAELLVLKYVITSGLVLLLCDALLTLGSEINAIWCRRMNAIAVIYLLNRYAFLLTIPLQFAYYVLPDPTVRTYTTLNVLVVFMGAIASVANMVLLAMRVCAIYGKSRAVVVLFGTIGVSRVVISLVGQLKSLTSIPLAPLASGCTSPEGRLSFIGITLTSRLTNL